MFFNDPRFSTGFGFNTPNTFNTLPYAQVSNVIGLPEYNLLLQRIEELRLQVHQLQQWQTLNHVQRPGFGVGAVNAIASDVSPVRLRESDTMIFMELFIPQIAQPGDIEVEVHGHRITCRTRIPVQPQNRWMLASALPRGVELFELPDGRIELCWITTASFQTKEIEASFREGYLCICVPKTDVSSKHSVKVVRDTASNRRAAGDMNS